MVYFYLTQFSVLLFCLMKECSAINILQISALEAAQEITFISHKFVYTSYYDAHQYNFKIIMMMMCEDDLKCTWHLTIQQRVI